jgi:hypothetical protein
VVAGKTLILVRFDRTFPRLAEIALQGVSFFVERRFVGRIAKFSERPLCYVDLRRSAEGILQKTLCHEAS